MPRHASLAEQLKALLAYRARPEGQIEPVKTNWRTQPANDNTPAPDMRIERRLEIVPSIQAIEGEMGKPPVRNESGQVVAIGALRFSDGTQTERAYTNGPEGKVIQYDMRLPVGAMMHTLERQAKEAGGKGETHYETNASNGYFADILGTAPARHKPGRRNKKKGKSYTADESRAMLADAYRNTPTLPPVTRFPPGLPCGGAKVADSFVGMKKAARGESGAIAWQDLATLKSHRHMWAETVAYLTKNDVDTLDKAMNARTLADLGGGRSKRTALRRGKERLLVANDNLRAALSIAS